MSHKSTEKNGGNIGNHSVINRDTKIKNKLMRVYEDIASGRTAIKRIMDEYRVSTDVTGIKNNPNEYSEDPKYILSLFLSVINLSVQTVDLISELPSLDIVEEQ